MRVNVLPLLWCPACGASKLEHAIFRAKTDEEILDGVLWCMHCATWYPVEDGLLELLTGDLAYGEDRAQFWANHTAALERLGLFPDTEKPQSNDNELQAKQQSHFDWYAHNATQTYSEYEQTPFWLAADRIAYSSWRDEIQVGRWLLDVGCAQGRSTFKVMDLDINIVGLDISKHLIRQAIQRYRQGKYRANATFFAADASVFPIVNESFDYVLIYGVLHHLPKPAATCSEVARVLKPGGIYFGSENNQTVFRGIFDFLQRLNPIWHEEAGPEALISSSRLKKWFQSTGVQIETKTSVFLPPHLINLVSEGAGYRLLKNFDRIGQSVAFLRQNGGLLLVRGKKY